MLANQSSGHICTHLIDDSILTGHFEVVELGSRRIGQEGVWFPFLGSVVPTQEAPLHREILHLER